jgi:hypothetical protein
MVQVEARFSRVDAIAQVGMRLIGRGTSSHGFDKAPSGEGPSRPGQDTNLEL